MESLTTTKLISAVVLVSSFFFFLRSRKATKRISISEVDPRPLHPRNPIARIRKSQSSFIYYHTHVVDADHLRAAVQKGQSIEFDVYKGPDTIATIQHPPLFYKHQTLPLPANLPLEEAVHLFESGHPDTIVVLDAKSRRALSVIRELVERLGTHRVVVHAFAKELSFDPPPEGIEVEPHWVDEDLPLSEVVAAASPAGCQFRAAVALTCRHVTPDRLASPEWDVIGQVEKYTDNLGVDIIGLWLPGGRAPEVAVAERLLKRDLLVSYNIDSEKLDHTFPKPHVGMTDFLDRATTNN